VQHFNVARSRIRKQCGLDGCNFAASGNITGLIRELNIAQDASLFAPQLAECISFSLSLQNKPGILMKLTTIPLYPKLSSIDRGHNVSVLTGREFHHSQPQPHVSAGRPQTSSSNPGPAVDLRSPSTFRSTVTIMVRSVTVSISEVLSSCP